VLADSLVLRNRQLLVAANRLFAAEIKLKNGEFVLSYIGSNGAMPELFSNERTHYAPAFYHGSCSFVNYLAENYNVHLLLNGISSFGREQETIEQVTGKSLQALKKEWLDKLLKLK